MNVVNTVSQFNINNVFLLDIKQNIIMDGSFTKIIYSNECFTILGIFLILPKFNYIIDKNGKTNLLRFNNENYFFNNLIKIETQILEFYKKTTGCSKQSVCLLKEQISSKCFKLYLNHQKFDMEQPFQIFMDFKENNDRIILKISGIWENYNSIGITFKILLGTTLDAQRF
jgi:hypothetical protein